MSSSKVISRKDVKNAQAFMKKLCGLCAFAVNICLAPLRPKQRPNRIPGQSRYNPDHCHLQSAA